MTTATGSGATAVPPSLVLASGVSASGLVATSGRGGWTLTMTPGTSSGAPTFACSTGNASTLASVWPAVHSGQIGVGLAPTSIWASGGDPPFSWSAPGLPRGLTMGSSSGSIYGTPTAAGTFPVTVTITDAAAATISKTYSVVIAEATVVCPTTFTGWRGDYYGSPTSAVPCAVP